MTWKIPSLDECKPQIEPTEYMVLVRMSTFEARSAGGIILTDETKDRESWRAKVARLVAVSPLAFSYEKTWPAGSRPPQVGDAVFVGHYPGEVCEGADGAEYRLCSDREIAGIIERADAHKMERMSDAA